MRYLKLLRWFFSAVLLQIFFSLALAAFFSNMGRGDSSGWGDLIGVVIGVTLGGWLSAGVLLYHAGIKLKLKKWKIIISTIFVLPLNIGIIGVMSNMGVKINITMILLLTIWGLIYTAGRWRGFNDRAI
jgi:hypothetical protein